MEPLDVRLSLPVDYSSVHNLQDDDSLGTVFEEVWHLLLQRWFHLVFCNDLEVIPWCFAPSLHLGQSVLKLVEVNLMARSQTELIPDWYELSRQWRVTMETMEIGESLESQP